MIILLWALAVYFNGTNLKYIFSVSCYFARELFIAIHNMIVYGHVLLLKFKNCHLKKKGNVNDTQL